MSLTDFNEIESENSLEFSEKLIRALANPVFPALDNSLRAGRHISRDEFEHFDFLVENQDELALFYKRYAVDLQFASEGFFYLLPRSTTIFGRSVLSELEMLIGKTLCYLHLSPERLVNEGIFSFDDMRDELFSLIDEKLLYKFVNPRSNGSNLDQQKLQDKLKSALNRLKRLGMITFLPNDPTKFRITEAIFRFGIDVKTNENLLEAQKILIQQSQGRFFDKNENEDVIKKQKETDDQFELQSEEN